MKQPPSSNQESGSDRYSLRILCSRILAVYRDNIIAWSHVIPFLAWLFLMAALDLPWFGDPHPWKYAVRTVLCLALLFYYRPWRWYAPLRWQNIPLAVAVGAGVFLIWTFPSIPWGEGYSGLQEWYVRFGILPLGRLPEVEKGNIYAPETAGWTLALIRLGGSAFVIAVIEEFFWRGFLYRWLISRDFMRVKLNHVDWEAVAIVCVLFGLAHMQWLVGIFTGVVYLAMMIKTRDVWSVALAHVITNLLLGIYVLKTGTYMFW